MQGPIAAATAAGWAPNRTMAATVCSMTPATAPRQPAWAAPTTPAANIGQQDRRAVCGDDAERDIWPVGHHGVGAWAGARLPRGGDVHRIVAVDLHKADERGRGSSDCARGTGAVFQHSVARVAAGEAAIQAGERAARDATLAPEEAMRDSQPRGADWFGVGAHVQRSKPGGAGQSGWQSARALNSRPIRSGSARRRAASISAAARAGGWVRARASVRWNRPRRARKMPCGIGPCVAAPAARAAAETAAKSTWAVMSAVPGDDKGSTGWPSRKA